MKLFIGLVLAACVLQSIALPTAILEEELVPAAEFVPKNEGADFFREEIDRYFVRYLSFYDRTTAQLRNYRLSHVDVVTAIYQSMMTIFGDDIESVRQASYEMNDLIDEKRNEIGSVNDCLRGIIDDRTANARVVGSTIQSCALFANTTLQGLLRETFYPVFAEIQTRVSTVPLVVIEILASGNVLQDEDAILDYLRGHYEIIDLQWMNSVSQRLRWETNRFVTDGEFLVDEMAECMGESVIQFLLTNSRLEGELRDC